MGRAQVGLGDPAFSSLRTQMFTPWDIRGMESASMRRSDQGRMRRELADLFASARSGELTRADFAARLESLHQRFLGEDAATPNMVEQRRAASKAYDDLTLGTDRHHNLERLAEALGIDSP